MLRVRRRKKSRVSGMAALFVNRAAGESLGLSQCKTLVNPTSEPWANIHNRLRNLARRANFIPYKFSRISPLDPAKVIDSEPIGRRQAFLSFITCAARVIDAIVAVWISTTRSSAYSEIANF
jgi:hypothetical protein